MTTPVRSSCGHVVDSQITEFDFLFLLFILATGSLLQHTGTRALEHVGWVVVVYGLSCPMTGRILVPPARDQTWTPCIESSVLSTGPPGKSLNLISF